MERSKLANKGIFPLLKCALSSTLITLVIDSREKGGFMKLLINTPLWVVRVEEEHTALSVLVIFVFTQIVTLITLGLMKRAISNGQRTGIIAISWPLLLLIMGNIFLIVIALRAVISLFV